MKPTKRDRFVPPHKARRRAHEIAQFRRGIFERALLEAAAQMDGLITALQGIEGAPVQPPDVRTQSLPH